ncbi:MAG: RHS repeat-associated core domain-containing protein [Terracidiphilus sp.]
MFPRYLYSANGHRVAKGTIASWTCDPSSNGLTTAKNETDYILGPGGEQVTEVAEDANGTMNWQRTYVNAASGLIATYESVPNPLYNPAQYNPANPTVDPPTIAMPSFRLTDWLGTMRATTDASGVLQGTCTGLPFGDGVACNGDIPDPHHFTGKERDTETGNDFFNARYFGSLTGRFLTPDPLPWIHWQRGNKDDQGKFAAYIANPQNFNMYAYVNNNPLNKTDPTGMNPCGTSGDEGCNVTVTFRSRSKDANGNYNDSFTGMKGQEDYNATVTISATSKDGTTRTTTFLARTIPSDPSSAATIKDGTYQGTLSFHAGHPAISLNSGGQVPTVAPNPSSGPNHGKGYATGIYGPHIGGYDPSKVAPQGPIFDSHNKPWSTGCSLVDRDQYGYFEVAAGLRSLPGSPAQQNFTVVYDTDENR